MTDKSPETVEKKPEEKKKRWADEEDEADISKDLAKTSIPKNEPKTAENPLAIKPTVDDLNQGVSIEIQQDDPNSPLHSAKTFEELNLSKDLLNGLYEMGFKKPSKIQEAALPVILQGKNLIGQAQSGTGKTAAFVLGVLHKCDFTKNYPQAMIACPTRELARQIQSVVLNIGKFVKPNITMCLKEVEIEGKIKSQILIGTPGKMIGHMDDGKFDPRAIKIIVLDEADQMIGDSLGEQSLKIRKKLAPNCQYLLFSATYRDDVRKYAQKFVPSNNRAEITLKKEELSIKAIQQYCIKCLSEKEKVDILGDLYGYLTIGQSIIFAHTKRAVHEVAQAMVKSGHKVEQLTSDNTPEQRDDIIDRFRAAKIKVLVATNVLARGIDILGVTLVINYELPLDRDNKIDYETYLHRVGRSGRFGRSGIAINLVHDRESEENVKKLSDHFKRPIEDFPKKDIDQFETKLQQVIDANQREMFKKAEEEKKREEEEKSKKQPPPQPTSSPQKENPLVIGVDSTGKRKVTTQQN